MESNESVRRRIVTMFCAAGGWTEDYDSVIVDGLSVVRSIPESFRHAADFISGSGFDEHILDSIPPLRRIIIGDPKMLDAGFNGVYFSDSNLEVAFPETDWESLGYTGGVRVMMFPGENPSIATIIHEFGHYIDDCYIRGQQHTQQFEALQLGMSIEYAVVYCLAMDSVNEDPSGQMRLFPNTNDYYWYERVPTRIWTVISPSQYALATFAEWFAEMFLKYCQGCAWLSTCCPKTWAFIDYALRGDVALTKPKNFYLSPKHFEATA